MIFLQKAVAVFFISPNISVMFICVKNILKVVYTIYTVSDFLKFSKIIFYFVNLHIKKYYISAGVL